jgi:small multidrug resistance pump
VAFYFLA